MTIDEIKHRLFEEIQLRGRDDKFIDQNEEREILQIAIHQGIEIDRARVALGEVCGSEDFTVESQLRTRVRERCKRALETSGFIDRATFDAIVADTRESAKGRLLEIDLKRLVVTVMEDHGLNKVKTGWLTNWYAAVKRELGIC